MDQNVTKNWDAGASQTATLRPPHLQYSHSPQIPSSSTVHGVRRSIPRCPSLPVMQLPKIINTADLHFTRKPRELRRPSSANTIRRSVSGMKRLLPLKLNSPPLPASPSWKSPSPTADQAARYEGRQVPEPKAPAPRQLGASFAIRLPQIKSKSSGYRDMPMYTDLSSPAFNRFYGAEERSCQTCSPGSLCNESCIIDGYSSTEDSRSGCTDTEEVDFFDEAASFASGDYTTSSRTRQYSELSFKCLGENHASEGIWVRTTSNQWRPGAARSLDPTRPLPELLASSMPAAVDVEGWISDSTGSECDDSDFERGDFSCATALAPAKAQVVELGRGDLNIMIPPRSSSLARVRSNKSPTRGRKSRMGMHQGGRSLTPKYSNPWNDDRSSERVGRSKSRRERSDLAMASPPASPDCSPKSIPLSRSSGAKQAGRTTFGRSASNQLYQAINRPNSPPSPTTPIHEMIDAIERCIHGFPSTMLLLDAPCISHMRNHLRQYSSRVDDSSLMSPFPTPAERRFHRSPLRGPGLRRDASPSPPLDSPGRDLPASYVLPPLTKIDTSMGSPEPSLSSPLPSPPFVPFETRPPSSNSATSSFAARMNQQHNLQPFRTIFPKTSDFMRSALYAHILAYIFLNSLSRSSAGSQSQGAHPVYASTTWIPSKAASTLGIPSGTQIPTDRFSVLISSLEDQVVTCIRKLVGGMEGKVGWSVEEGSGDRFLDRVFLRALVEVVRGCEIRDII